MIIEESNYLEHYGILRRSGRYPWGSGGPEHATTASFLGYVESLRKQGLSEVEIAKGFGTTTTQLRAARSIAVNEKRQGDIAQAQRLKEKGYSNVEIGKRMGINESSVRSLLAPGAKDKADVLQTTASVLRKQVDEKGAIDVGKGVENHLGISDTKLSTAIAVLKEEGYVTHDVKVPQVGTGKLTTIKVLAKPDTPWSELVRDPSKIGTVTDYSPDGGRTYIGMLPPLQIRSSRIKVKYAEDGGGAEDGVIYIRPGVKDLSLGAARYAQVRIAVDGTHYLKGMAVIKDGLPDGVDIVFNTNKRNTGNKLDAMKPQKNDPEDPNPFGSTVRQITDAKGRLTSALNIVGTKAGSGEEGSWDTWSRSLSSQFLSKQSPSLAKGQLAMTYERRKAQLDEIMALTNPAVRRKLLESFADDVDSAAVHLRAAALPRQRTRVILPMNTKTMKENEVYAPGFRNGERVVLVRHPHGGPFEIPELTVNNKSAVARRILGDAADAIGIHSKVAERLSGADFDGDTVLVIPNNAGKVKTAPALEGLRHFDPKAAYPAYEGMPRMTARQKGMEMGRISNLITDMTIRGANTSELAAAVRHSMVVIDAEKHHLNYKESARANGIAHLMEKYQGKPTGGARTLISRASARQEVPVRKPRSAAKGGPIDRATGQRVFEPTGETFVRGGKVVVRTQRSTKLAEAADAHTLSSGTPMEKVYADHSNRLKALANEARRASVHVRSTAYSPSAKAAYSNEVAQLEAKLSTALRNAPIERQAQALANATISAKRRANPDMGADELKKVKVQALNEARARTGAAKQRITITQEEWNAIQAGAISNNKLNQILQHADLDQVKKLATPREGYVMTNTKLARARSMLASGYDRAEIADALGVAESTLSSALRE